MAASTFVPVGKLSDFTTTNRTSLDPKNPLPYTCKQVTLKIPHEGGQKEKKLAIFYRPDLKKFWAVNNICPHQGGSLTHGSLLDIEDMGIRWGVAVVCPLHGWAFDADSGECDRSRYVLDVHDVKIGEDGQDPDLLVSVVVKNREVAGPRRDFGGIAIGT